MEELQQTWTNFFLYIKYGSLQVSLKNFVFCHIAMAGNLVAL